MILVPYEKEKLNYNSYKYSNNYRILKEFAESGIECARVDGYITANAHICAKSLKSSIRRFKFGGFDAFVRKGEVYLIRLDEVHNGD